MLPIRMQGKENLCIDRDLKLYNGYSNLPFTPATAKAMALYKNSPSICWTLSKLSFTSAQDYLL